jgi:hypothetical protein
MGSTSDGNDASTLLVQFEVHTNIAVSYCAFYSKFPMSISSFNRAG